MPEEYQNVRGRKKEPRFVKGYPQRPTTLIRRTSRNNIRTNLLRQERPRRHARAWGYRTRQSIDQYHEDRAANVVGSLQERIFYQALIDHGFSPGIDFTFQSGQFGGRAQLGGLVADFLFPYPMLIIQVQSYWHTISLYQERRDNDQSAILQSFGWQVLGVWPNTIMDPAALDRWIERNLMQMWGTTTQSLGISGSRDLPYLQVVFGDRWKPLTDQINQQLTDILEAI